MARSLRGLATTTWWPSWASSAFAHGEWVPASMATRAAGIPAKRWRNAAGVLGSRDSSTIAPAPSTAHRWLWRSPRSMPNVIRGTLPVLIVEVVVALSVIVVASVMAGLP